MGDINIKQNVVFQLLEELTVVNDLSKVQRRLLLISFRLMMNPVDLMLLREIAKRKGLAHRHYSVMDKSRISIVYNLEALQLLTLVENKYILTPLGNEVLKTEETNIASHVSWYVSHIEESRDAF